jgi:hypothetical protein
MFAVSDNFLPGSDIGSSGSLVLILGWARSFSFSSTPLVLATPSFSAAMIHKEKADPIARARVDLRYWLSDGQKPRTLKRSMAVN